MLAAAQKAMTAVAVVRIENNFMMDSNHSTTRVFTMVTVFDEPPADQAQMPGVTACLRRTSLDMEHARTVHERMGLRKVCSETRCGVMGNQTRRTA
jgi:hypothetical protein